jgi:hypothetical protein
MQAVAAAVVLTHQVAQLVVLVVAALGALTEMVAMQILILVVVVVQLAAKVQAQLGRAVTAVAVSSSSNTP